MDSNFDTWKLEWLDNQDYADSNSEAKCRKFIRACERILVFFPTRIAKQSGEVEFANLAKVEQMKAEAIVWLNSKTVPCNVRLYNFDNFRD